MVGMDNGGKERHSINWGELEMLNIRKSSVLVVAALLVVCAGSAAQAASFSTSNVSPDRIEVKDVIHPLAPQSLTQSTDPNTIVPGSVACGAGGITTDNGYWRLFDLNSLAPGQFCTKNVDYAIETATGPQTMTVNVYCLDAGLPFLLQFLNLAGSNVQNQPDADLEFFNIPVAGCCDTQSQDMAVELRSEDCLESGTCLQLFIGSNNLGQSAASYINADDCGISDPTSLAGIGFPNMHLIMVVNGNDDTSDDGGDGGAGDGGGGDGGGGDGGGVPSTTGTGLMLLIVAFLGTSALFLRRKATN